MGMEYNKYYIEEIHSATISITANAMDILWSDSQGNLSITSEVLPISENKIPIAICIARTNFFGQNELARFISLKHMNALNTNSGYNQLSNIIFGQTRMNNNYNYNSAFLNANDKNGYISEVNPSNHTPSVHIFDSNNNWNISELGNIGSYPMTDINGLTNTNYILSHVTSQSNWRTESTITQKNASGYCAPACCCARYFTLGTNAGDWYLPAVGELAVVAAQSSNINIILNNISNIYPELCINSLYMNGINYSSTDKYYWTSSAAAGFGTSICEYAVSMGASACCSSCNTDNAFPCIAMIQPNLGTKSEYVNSNNNKITFEVNPHKVYLDTDTNKYYQWNGTQLVEVHI